MINVIAWNIESGGAEIETIGNQMKAMRDIDIWGLSEVPGPQAIAPLKRAATDAGLETFEGLLGNTGGGDRLMIIYNAERFVLEGDFELEDINIANSGRAPLVVKLKDRQTETSFYFMVNHFFRGNRSKRHQQSRLLNQWAEEQTIPVIAVGDYNFDWNVNNGDTNRGLGYDLLTAGEIFEWVRPEILVRTQCSNTSDGGCRYNSVLDFVFVANQPSKWSSSSQIIQTPNDFPDNDQTSDHRPVLGTFIIPDKKSAEEIKLLILASIANLESGIQVMKSLIDQIH